MRVALRVTARARRFTLRLASDGDGAVLTMPPGVPLEAVEAFIQGHRGWLARALVKQPALMAVGDGTEIPIDGKARRVRVDQGGPLTPRLVDDRLVLGASRPPGPRIASWLKLRARSSLVPAVADFADQLGQPVAGVTLRDTRSRWGSCSSTGRIGLSWRLAMAPPAIQAYVAAHEAAHLVEMNHSPRYWAVLEGLMPDYATHRAWLRREGRGLHAFDFRA
ncbi:MAG: SprT family zinc-dependent metalloprotease [Pseudomonadota bacterium]